MMRAIVPLAGPDFLDPRYGVKPLVEVEGEPLIRRAITTRAWWRSGRLRSEGLVFVLRDMPEAQTLRIQLSDWFPGATFVLLGQLTRGALFSALAGAALLDESPAPLVIDLVDILFDIDDAQLDGLSAGDVGAAAPWFLSNLPSYSYLELNSRGDVARTREKQVISAHASAGAYFFSNPGMFLKASAYAIANAKDLMHSSIHFICPALNGVIAEGKRVLALETANVRPISKMFHEAVAAS